MSRDSLAVSISHMAYLLGCDRAASKVEALKLALERRSVNLQSTHRHWKPSKTVCGRAEQPWGLSSVNLIGKSNAFAAILICKLPRKVRIDRIDAGLSPEAQQMLQALLGSWRTWQISITRQDLVSDLPPVSEQVAPDSSSGTASPLPETSPGWSAPTRVGMQLCRGHRGSPVASGPKCWPKGHAQIPWRRKSKRSASCPPSQSGGTRARLSKPCSTFPKGAEPRPTLLQEPLAKGSQGRNKLLTHRSYGRGKFPGRQTMAGPCRFSASNDVFS